MDKVVLTTGGTGGHIFPALAVADAIRKKNPDSRILFLGSEYGPEAKLAANAGVEFMGLPVRGLLGRGLRALTALGRMGIAMAQATAILRQFQPDAVAGFGGYASFAPILSATWLNLPVLLHEQNAIAGASNKILAPRVQKVCVSVPGTKGFSSDYVVTGNPVRSDIVASCKSGAVQGVNKRLLIVGGSQGAHGINRMMFKIAPSLKDAGVEILHQTGEKDFAEAKETYGRLGYENALPMPFIDDMAKAYSWADLCLCRSGASTIAELCAVGMPSILIPFPAAIHDHQTVNAKTLADVGAAFLHQENGLDERQILSEITSLLDDRERLDAMARAAISLAKPDAADTLANMIAEIAKTNE